MEGSFFFVLPGVRACEGEMIYLVELDSDSCILLVFSFFCCMNWFSKPWRIEKGNMHKTVLIYLWL